MRESISGPRSIAIRMRGTRVPRAEQSFTRNKIADVARVLWPNKTAAHLAAAANCSVRAAKFYLAGDREWSGAAVSAIINEITTRD